VMGLSARRTEPARTEKSPRTMTWGCSASETLDFRTRFAVAPIGQLPLDTKWGFEGRQLEVGGCEVVGKWTAGFPGIAGRHFSAPCRVTTLSMPTRTSRDRGKRYDIKMPCSRRGRPVEIAKTNKASWVRSHVEDFPLIRGSTAASGSNLIGKRSLLNSHEVRP